MSSPKSRLSNLRKVRYVEGIVLLPATLPAVGGAAEVVLGRHRPNFFYDLRLTPLIDDRWDGRTDL